VPFTPQQQAIMQAALATSFASAALEYVRLPGVYPAFAAWIEASADFPATITREQLAGADLLVTTIANGLFEAGPDEPAP
jgi:hypothetical protein